MPIIGTAITLVRPRYFFGGLRPRETTKSSIFMHNLLFMHEVHSFYKGWYLTIVITSMDLSLVYGYTRGYTPTYPEQYIKNVQEWHIVKMHGVLLSHARMPASSLACQIRQRPGRDSRAVVTPFVQDNNYLPRNFATLGPLELRPPFIRI